MSELTQSDRLVLPANLRSRQGRQTLPAQGPETEGSGAGRIVAFRRKHLPEAAEKHFRPTIELGGRPRSVLTGERAPAEVYGVNHPEHRRRPRLVSTGNPGRIA